MADAPGRHPAAPWLMAAAIELDVPTQVYGADQYHAACVIAFPSPVLPLRAIIALKVRAEVERAARSREARHGLATRYLTEEDLAAVEPGAALASARAAIDVDTEIERALAAFRARRFFVVIDGSRCDDLEAVITLTPATTIRFVRILPLRGGHA